MIIQYCGRMIANGGLESVVADVNVGNRNPVTKMKDRECVEFLQWALPRLDYRWRGFRKVRRQVCKRVGKRLVELGIGSVAAYRDYLLSHPDEWEVFDSFLYISISRFYRDRKIFDLIGDELLPGLAARATDEHRKDLLVWSAGSCSGEEAYTIRILWEHSVFGTLNAPVKLRVIATDKTSFLLNRAKEGLYSPGSVKDLPEHYVSLAFSKDGGGFRVRDGIKKGVEFRRQDIRRDIPEEMFDLILCRNLVFTYFDDDLQRLVLERISEHLRDGGYLVTGSQEELPGGFGRLVRYKIKGVYQKTSHKLTRTE